MTRYNVVTSFSAAGYEQYGRRFIETFRQYWPHEVRLLVYVEHPDDGAIGGYLNTLAIDLNESVHYRTFIERHKDNMVARGKQPHPKFPWKAKHTREGYNFRQDAYKFCCKVFALEHAAELLGKGRMFWVDADIETFDIVPLGFLERMLPPDVGLSYLGRGDTYHPECGFVGYNLDMECVHEFLHYFAGLYATDTVFDLFEWHDSWVFDWLRRLMTHVPTMDLNPPVRSNPLGSSAVGRYMIHYKGDRKDYRPCARAELIDRQRRGIFT